MKREILKKHLLVIIAVLIILPVLGQDNNEKTEETTNSGWQIDVTPYMWLAGAKVDIGFRSTEIGQIKADFTDILQNLKLAAFFHAEAKNGKWMVIGDLAYVKIKKEGNLELMDAPVPTKLEVKETITELAVGYNFVNNEDAFLIDGFAGWRYIGLDNYMTVGSADVLDRFYTANDPFIGARFKINYEAWMFSMRGDLGGFGIGSESSWKLNLLGAYQFSDLFSLYFGIQSFGVDIEKNDFNIDVMNTGLAFGGNFRF